AFGEDIGRSIHAPHNFADTNCIVYTGTHDNNTTRGWYEEEVDNDTKRRMEDYLGTKVTSHSAATQLIRTALSSIADIAIIPMQDLLNKPAKSRMNIPASLTGNWTWRLKPGELKAGLSDEIRRYVELYGR
ncbi:MAG: 4-alpha-glucanotransferase, partial [Sphingobacteriales bacterium]